MIKTTTHTIKPILDTIKVKDRDPYEQAKKSVELIHTIDNIDDPCVIIDERANNDIPFMKRNKKYKATFTLYNLYTQAKNGYKHFSEKRRTGVFLNESYITCCHNVSSILKNFYEDYSETIYKKFKITIEKNKNLLGPFELIVYELQNKYYKYQLLTSNYAKIELLDTICELMLVILKMIKFATIERILAEISYHEEYKISYYIIMAEILFSYTKIENQHIKNVNTTYNFLSSLVYNEYTGLSSTMLKALELEATIMNSFCDKYNELIKHINESGLNYVRKNIKLNNQNSLT
jgi:hypothetical protein